MQSTGSSFLGSKSRSQLSWSICDISCQLCISEPIKGDCKCMAEILTIMRLYAEHRFRLVGVKVTLSYFYCNSWNFISALYLFNWLKEIEMKLFSRKVYMPEGTYNVFTPAGTIGLPFVCLSVNLMIKVDENWCMNRWQYGDYACHFVLFLLIKFSGFMARYSKILWHELLPHFYYYQFETWCAWSL